MMEAIYFTKSGYDSFLSKMSDKKTELINVQNERAEALKETSESDMNDPVLVDLQQRETSLNLTVVNMEKLLTQAQVVNIDPENRNTQQVKIGSLLEIQRTNITNDIEHPIEIWEVSGYDETDVQNRMLSYNSPIGKALIGASEGDVVEGVMIGNQEFEIEIIKLYKNWTEV